MAIPAEKYTLGGSVSGLLDTVVLNNGQDSLALSADGSFTFSNALPAGSTYSVTVQTQPLNQTCTVSNGNGTITNANVTNVTINCALNARTIGGEVDGLDNGESLVLQNNGSDNLTVNEDGNYIFDTAIAQGTPYDVTVRTQPRTQNCLVTNGSGIAGSTNITNVAINCSETYTVGGNVFGLVGNLTLVNNGVPLPINTDGSFTFPGALETGQTYAVTVQTPPTYQTCTVSQGNGTIANANVTNITVNCSTETTQIQGEVTGLASGTVTIQNNGTGDLGLSTNEPTTFYTVTRGSSYRITVSQQPTGQFCTVANGSGIANTPVIDNVQIICHADSYTVGGEVAGLSGTVVLQNNLEDNLTLLANGSFTFSNPVAFGDPYNVTVFSQPANQTCTVSNGSGTMGAADVDNVAVTCVEHTTTLTPSISNLALSVTGLTEYGLNPTTSGKTRIITISNGGSAPAENITVSSPQWPAGTTNSSSCSGNLGAGSQCTISIVPGNTATSDGTNPCAKTAPIPTVIEVKANNAPTVSINVVVLTYGCIYQGGYIYAFDDTTADSNSVGGKVATTTDLTPTGIIWSSNGTGSRASNVAYDAIFGIAETSTSASPIPASGQITGQSACQGAMDGTCNANNTLVFYSVPNKNPAINLNFYAAGRCQSFTSGNFNDWYLPAICELGYGITLCGSSGAPSLQNMQSNLVDFNSLNLLTGDYWSATENSVDPRLRVWFQSFSSGTSNQADTSKNVDVFNTRCSRKLSIN